MEIQQPQPSTVQHQPEGITHSHVAPNSSEQKRTIHHCHCEVGLQSFPWIRLVTSSPVYSRGCGNQVTTVNANKRQIDCSATVSRIFSSLCEFVIGWLGAQQVEEVVPFGVLLTNLEAWEGTVSTHCCFRRAYCQQSSTMNFNGCLISIQLLL